MDRKELEAKRILALREFKDVEKILNLDCHYIDELEKDLEKERKLNKEIKVRFVKCNTCTPEMKGNCLMFNENLCEGERCEELVDIMSLLDKRDTDDKISQLEIELENLNSRNNKLEEDNYNLSCNLNEITNQLETANKLLRNIVEVYPEIKKNWDLGMYPFLERYFK